MELLTLVKTLFPSEEWNPWRRSYDFDGQSVSYWNDGLEFDSRLGQAKDYNNMFAFTSSQLDVNHCKGSVKLHRVW